METVTFDQEDAPFLEWMTEYPEGYVLNAERGEASSYARLHRSGCSHLKAHRTGTFTEEKRIKVCAKDPESLAAWVQKHRPNASAMQLCQDCVQDLPAGHDGKRGSTAPSASETRPVEPFSTAQYKSALRAVENRLSEVHFKMLQAQHAAPRRAIRAAELASAVGYESHEPANAHYGRLGRYVAEELGEEPTERGEGKGMWWPFIAYGEGSIEAGDFRWVMHPALAQALEELGWVESPEGGISSSARASGSATPFQEGETYHRRQDLHARYGGQQQGGISTPADFPLVFLFTSASGSDFGYRDEFRPDGTFWYTGEGQRGDMEMTRGNRAIRDH